MIKVTISNCAQLKKRIGKLGEGGARAVARTIKEFPARGRPAITKAIQGRYNVKPKDVKAAYKRSQKSGRVKFMGQVIDNMQLVYQGEKVDGV